MHLLALSSCVFTVSFMHSCQGAAHVVLSHILHKALQQVMSPNVLGSVSSVVAFKHARVLLFVVRAILSIKGSNQLWFNSQDAGSILWSSPILVPNFPIKQVPQTLTGVIFIVNGLHCHEHIHKFGQQSSGISPFQQFSNLGAILVQTINCTHQRQNQSLSKSPSHSFKIKVKTKAGPKGFLTSHFPFLSSFTPLSVG